MKRFLFLLAAAVLLASAPAPACFGPKLYVGVGKGETETLLYELMALYLKEKTGIEAVPTDLAGRDPLAELAAESVDMAFAVAGEGDFPVLLAPPGGPRLLCGRRPLEDLRFTTVAPALERLDGLLTGEALADLRMKVRAGAAVKAGVRRFLMERRWI